ncbi:ETX/MTX2 family pore-forming toxin [Bacillus bombysepticus]
MKNKKNMKRKVAATSSIITLATSFAFASPELTKADSKNVLNTGYAQQQRLADSVAPGYVPVEIQDVRGLQDLWHDSSIIKAPLASLLRMSTDAIDMKSTSFNFLYYQQPSYSVDLLQKKDEPSSPTYLGVTNLSHSGGTSEQTLYSSSFSKAVTSTVTATTTHGAKVGAKAGAKLKVPLVAEANVELNAEYNFAQAGTNTDSETVTYMVPAQPVKLQPDETAKVTASLRMVEASGEVRLRTTYNGVVDTLITNRPEDLENTTGLGNWMKAITGINEDLANYWNYSTQNPNVAYQDGKGTYKATYGTLVDIKVEISKKSDNKDSTDNTPIRSYSYTVTPEIAKK